MVSHTVYCHVNAWSSYYYPHYLFPGLCVTVIVIHTKYCQGAACKSYLYPHHLLFRPAHDSYGYLRYLESRPAHHHYLWCTSKNNDHVHHKMCHYDVGTSAWTYHSKFFVKPVREIQVYHNYHAYYHRFFLTSFVFPFFFF